MRPEHQHIQAHGSRGLGPNQIPHLLTSTPKFGPLFESVGRPDLQWFVASAYYIVAHAYECSASLDASIALCTDKPWNVSEWFPEFTHCVHQTGATLVQTNTGSPDFVDGYARVSCSAEDKLLILLVLLFGVDTCWADGVPKEGPDPVKAYVEELRCALARRYPSQLF